MQNPPSILFVFAHPDDESFLGAATMAAFSELGSQLTVCSATRGEEGEIAEGIDATRENLGQVREAELRAAMAEVGVHDVRFLDYRDSGMAGTPTNDADGAFMRVPPEEAGRRIAGIIDEIRPDILVGFGPEGVYLHPDHIAAHLALRAAVAMAGEDQARHRVEAFLYAGVPREHFIELQKIEGNPFSDFSAETVELMGTPKELLTHAVDGQRFQSQIIAALKCHATQFGEGDPFDWLPSHLAVEMSRYNFFQMAPLPWEGETSLPSLFVPLR